MLRNLRSHNYISIISNNYGHVHNYLHVTSVNPDVSEHVQYIVRYTTIYDGHAHYYTKGTALEIEVVGEW